MDAIDDCGKLPRTAITIPTPEDLTRVNPFILVIV